MEKLQMKTSNLLDENEKKLLELFPHVASEIEVADDQLIACFDAEVTTEIIEEIAKMQPLYAVLHDASLENDATFANFEELFKTCSPDTTSMVI